MRIDSTTRELVFEERNCWCDSGQVWDQITWKNCELCNGTGKDPQNARRNCRRCNPPGGSSFKRKGQMPDYAATMAHDECNGTGRRMERATDSISWLEVLHHIPIKVSFGEGLPAMTEMIGLGSIGGTCIDYGEMFRFAQAKYQSVSQDDKDIATRMAKQAVYQRWLEKRGKDTIQGSTLCDRKSTKVCDELVLVVTPNSYAVFGFVLDGEKASVIGV